MVETMTETPEFLYRVKEKVTEIQKKAGEILLNPQEYNISERVIAKAGTDYTTAVDQYVENFVRTELEKAFPNIGFLGEESDFETSGGLHWIVDPIDGTAVFTLGGENYSNSIALANSKTGRVLFGSIYQPTKERQFTRIANPNDPRGNPIEVLESFPINNPKQGKIVISRVPIPYQLGCLPEMKGCAYGTRDHLGKIPGIEGRLARVFEKDPYEEFKRDFGAINARPAAGSSALFNCGIANGENHFGIFLWQGIWDMAVGALFSGDVGCIVRCTSSEDSMDFTRNRIELERRIATFKRRNLVHVTVFPNPKVEREVMKRFNQAP